jgi:hypothetical protein
MGEGIVQSISFLCFRMDEACVISMADKSNRVSFDGTFPAA